MKFPPLWEKTGTIDTLLYDLSVLKTAFSFLDFDKEEAILFRRKSLLKSALYSARIEGNTLSEYDTSHPPRGKDREKREIQNLVTAYEYLDRYAPRRITPDITLHLHSMVAGGVLEEPGLFRTEESAIFNAAGVAVYLTPSPASVHSLMGEWYRYVNSISESNPLHAAVAHIWFEKIHPFLDGNGRVGRLLSYWMLKKGGYDFGGFVPIEKYIDGHKDQYYYGLSRNTQNITIFIEFFLNALLLQARESIEEAKNPKHHAYLDLLPRRGELLAIIQDHPMISFDAIRRRFLHVSDRMLHYDITVLIRKGLIRKVGSTRGSLYTVSEAS